VRPALLRRAAFSDVGQKLDSLGIDMSCSRS
jgi:hypothetical protein